VKLIVIGLVGPPALAAGLADGFAAGVADALAIGVAVEQGHIAALGVVVIHSRIDRAGGAVRAGAVAARV
jgi:hypothetical protein